MSALREIPVWQIDDGPNVRENADPGLRASIETHGVLSPITVLEVGERYELLIGFRRMAAVRALGLEVVPAVVETERSPDLRLRQVAENVDRRGMPPMEIARALQAHLDDNPGLTKRDLAASIGKHHVWVSNKLALLRMDGDLQERVESGELPDYKALKLRPRLNDGRGRPRAIPLPSEQGRSRSVAVPIGRHQGAAAAGVAEVSIDLETNVVDVAFHAGDRGLFLTLSAEEARLLGRRLQQAGDALLVAVAS